MKLNIKVDAGNLFNAMREMQLKIGARDMRPIIEHEVGKVLEKASSSTQKANKKTINKNVMGAVVALQKKPGRRVSMPGQGKQPRRTRRTDQSGWYTAGGRAWQRSWTIPDSVYREYIESKKEQLKEKKKRVGLAKQTWVSIANDLGMQIKTPKYVKRAKVNGAIQRHQAKGTKVSPNPSKFTIHIIYGNPVGQYTKAVSALRRAVNGRTKFFYRNLENGVFDSAKEIAAKYPGLRITK